MCWWCCVRITHTYAHARKTRRIGRKLWHVLCFEQERYSPRADSGFGRNQEVMRIKTKVLVDDPLKYAQKHTLAKNNGNRRMQYKKGERELCFRKPFGRLLWFRFITSARCTTSFGLKRPAMTWNHFVGRLLGDKRRRKNRGNAQHTNTLDAVW